jgi:hypothetical protein
MDWLNTLDFERALVNCHKDFLGDWHRDPWGWPEFDWVATTRPEMLAARLNGNGTKRVAKIDVPKENFATRPAMVMDPIDRLIYQALVDRVSVGLSAGMATWAFGWRLPRDQPDSGRYVPNKDEWSWYRARLGRLSARYQAALLTDVVSFFASIPVDRISESVRTRSRGEVTNRLTDLLGSWGKVVGRSGLPQRCFASSLLANFYLRSVDDEVQRHAPGDDGRIAAARWMDDIWVFGDDVGGLRRAQLAIEAATRELGLNLGSGKTRVLEGTDVATAVATMEHSAVDEGLAFDPPITTRLEELVDSVIAEPELTPRTSVRFVTSRMRDKQIWTFVPSLVDATPRIPHGADHLARLFRDSDRWRDMEGWFVDYAGSSWASLSWTTAQLATMFPSADGGRGVVRDFLAARIGEHPEIAMNAVAVQRVSSWAPDTARQAIREAARSAGEPHERRILAMAAVGLRDEPAFVRTLLSEFDENQVTLAMLEDRQFRPLPTSADFA